MPHFDFEATQYPTGPGCYLMKDAEEVVIYVGKAKNLRRRLASYFQRRQREETTRQLIARVADIDVILVSNEVESLILENNLIKRHRPCYNRRLMEEESGYYYIALTEEDIPRLIPYRKNRAYRSLGPVRRVRIATRFGPYVKRRYRDGLLEHLLRAFPIRTCNPIPRMVCLSYHLGRCSGICEQEISREQYADLVAHAVDFLSHQHPDLTQQMRSQMWEHADRLEFEQAARMRDLVEALEHGLETQTVETDIGHDQDVVYFGGSQVLVAGVKRGAIQDLGMFDLDLGLGHAEACERFLFSHYLTNSPRELIVNHLSHPDEAERRLSTANRYAVRITLPQGNGERALLDFCERNYLYRISIAD
jgi:excinuclease ABC subunit C